MTLCIATFMSANAWHGRDALLSSPPMSPKRNKPSLPCVPCGAKCCRYVATQIDKPKRKREYDQVRWYLLHRGLSVFVDHDGGWFLEFEADCSALSEGHLCANYKTRPRVCRDYPGDSHDCEHAAEKSPYRQRFLTAEDFEAYLDERGIKWRWKKKKLAKAG